MQQIYYDGNGEPRHNNANIHKHAFEKKKKQTQRQQTNKDSITR